MKIVKSGIGRSGCEWIVSSMRVKSGLRVSDVPLWGWKGQCYPDSVKEAETSGWLRIGDVYPSAAS